MSLCFAVCAGYTENYSCVPVTCVYLVVIKIVGIEWEMSFSFINIFVKCTCRLWFMTPADVLLTVSFVCICGAEFPQLHAAFTIIFPS